MQSQSDVTVVIMLKCSIRTVGIRQHVSAIRNIAECVASDSASMARSAEYHIQGCTGLLIYRPAGIYNISPDKRKLHRR
jgi:hypothetical protein